MIIAIVLLVFNLPFIVCNLYYAYRADPCVNTIADGIAFNLSVWLQVDAYLRIALCGMFLIAGLLGCCSLNAGVTCGACTICFMLIYGLFSLAWSIVGSVLFWGKLNPMGACSDGVQGYMFAMLIINYVSVCCNCLYNIKNRQG